MYKINIISQSLSERSPVLAEQAKKRGTGKLHGVCDAKYKLLIVEEYLQKEHFSVSKEMPKGK